jgi:hypothetical protein
VLALTGLAGWCPGYRGARVTSIDGPGDRPDEAHRSTWLATRHVSADPDLSGRSGGAAKAEAL